MKKIIALLFLLCLLPLTVSAASYKVEVLVFEHSMATVENQEQWRDALEIPSSWGAIPVESGDVGNSVKLLPSSSLNLAQVRSKIELSDKYRVLYHKGWKQPIFAKDDETAAWIEVPGVLEGTIKLHKNKYLHVNADLLYTSMHGSVRLQQERRLKSKELHYLDHPLFGVLIRVVRL